MMVRRINTGGYTLVEVIVAIIIFSLIISILFSGFRTISRSWGRGQERMENQDHFRSALDLMRRQLSSAYPVMPRPDELNPQQPAPPIPMSYGARPPFFSGTTDSASFVSLYSLRMTSLPGLCVISYRLEQSESGLGLSLVEYESQYTCITPSRENEDLRSSAAFRYVLLDSIAEASFHFFGIDAIKAATMPPELVVSEWLSTWKAEEMGDLPVAIRFEYHLLPEAKVHFKEGEIVAKINSKGTIQNRFIRRIPGVPM